MESCYATNRQLLLKIQATQFRAHLASSIAWFDWNWWYDCHVCHLESFHCSSHCGRQLHRPNRRCMWQKVGAQKLESLKLKSGG